MSDYKIDTLEVESQIIAPAATTSTAGLQSASDKTKLDSVQSGATANSTDAQLRDRATHTGTQLASTISDFSSAVVATAPVSSVFGRTGVVTAQTGDYTATQVGAAPSSHVGSSGVTQHAVATQTVAGFMSTGDKTKLDGLPSVIPVTSVFGRTGTITAQNGDYTGTQVTNVPAGNIAAVTVQAALNELDSEKAGLALNNTFTGTQLIQNTVTIDNPSASSQLIIDANGSTTNPALLTFAGTAGTGDFKIQGDGGDVYWQGGGGRTLQMGAYHGIDLMGGRVSTAAIPFLAGASNSYNTRILNTTDAVGLIVKGNSTQTTDLFQLRNNAETELFTVTASGQVGIGQGSPATSAALEVASTTKGFLQPRMTTVQRLAISSPAEGLQVYDTDLSTVCRYSGTGWFYEFNIANTTIQSTTSSTYANLTEFVTPDLYPGNYILEFAGTFQSSATNTGIGLRLAQVTGTVSFVSINWRFSQAGNGTDKYYEYSQTSLADNVTSTATLSINTNYPAVALGIFSISSPGSVAIQIRSDVNGSAVSIRPTSILSIRKV